MNTSKHTQTADNMNLRPRRRSFAIAALVGVFVSLLIAAPASAGPVYQVIDADNDPYSGIYLRIGTSMGNADRTGSNYVIYGTSAELLCGAWGESVGPRANRRWHKVRLINGSNVARVGWVADRYMNTPNAANQLTPGEPECGGTPPPPSAPAPSGSSSTPIWIGAPFTGYWPGSPLPNDARPESHRPVFPVPDTGTSAMLRWTTTHRPARA